MNVSFLLKQYFNNLSDVSIDVFDTHTLNDVYQNVVKTLTSHFEIEVSVLQALSYCFYEILDNVHIHSGRPIGTAMTHFDAEKAILRVLVADDGMGIRESLAGNDKFCDITEKEALLKCIEDSVTDGKGMGSKIRNEIKSIIDKSHSVALDFSGVNVVSNSFSDECIAKLPLEIPLNSLKRAITFRNMTPMAGRSILVALQRRFKVK